MLYETIADQDHNYLLMRPLPLTAPSLLAPKVLTMTIQSLSPECNRRSRGGWSMRIEAAAGESDDDGVFSDPMLRR